MNKPPTALGAALADKGYVKRNVDFQIAISRFQNAGGEFGVAHAMLCAAFGRGDDSVVAPKREAGHTSAADKAISRVPTSRSRLPADHPGRQPGHAKRGAAVIAAVNISLFNSIVLPDGRKLGEIRWCDAPELAARYQRYSRIMLACHNFAIPADITTPLSAVVPEAELRGIVDAADRLNRVN